MWCLKNVENATGIWNISWDLAEVFNMYVLEFFVVLHK